MQTSLKTLSKQFQDDPQKMLMLLQRTKMLVDALQKAAYQWADNNGAFKTKKVSFRKIAKHIKTLDPDKASKKLAEWGLAQQDVFGLDKSKDGMVKKLGKQNGTRLFSQLVDAGCSKQFATAYWRLSVK